MFHRLALLLTLAPSCALAQPVADPAVLGFDPDTVRAGRLDGGKMWLFEDPPLDYLAETYNFRPDTSWFRRVRLAALRTPGCSASFVSPEGLVATNHHCAQAHVVQLSRPGENLLDNGFLAASREEERPVEGMHVDQMIAFEDVTNEVNGLIAETRAETDAERVEAQREATGAVRERLLRVRGVDPADEAAGTVVQVVALYQGGRYSAYTFRRHRDVRLVFAPEQRLGFFGGDADNFTYPRYCLDVALYRVYGDDGRPLASPHHFRFSGDAVQEGDLVFVIGNPGSTSRGLTVAQLELTRDVTTPALLDAFGRRIQAIERYLATGPDAPDPVRAQLFGLSNSRKVFAGRIDALGTPYLLARRQAAERDFLAASPEAGALVERVGGVVAEQRALAPQTRAFLALANPTLTSATLRRAFAARQVAAAQAAGDADALAEAQEAFDEIGDRRASLERDYLAAEVEALRTYFAEMGRPLPDVLEGSSAEVVADRVLAATAFADSARATAALAGDPSGDPAAQIVAAIAEDYADWQSAQAGLQAQGQTLARELGRARFAAYGAAVPPDATFSLRFTDGLVRGYPYNGTEAPPMTTLAGLFDRHHSFGAEGDGPTDWTLPQRWLDAEDDLDLTTPLNFASTSDTIGGNSGAPAVNRDLELVGLNFDRTIEGLARDYLYWAGRGRNVMVSARAILHALDVVYDGDALVRELTGE